jgi:hypothetical protein
MLKRYHVNGTEKSANALEESAAFFSSKKEDDLFTQAKKEGTTETVKKQAKEFISNIR